MSTTSRTSFIAVCATAIILLVALIGSLFSKPVLIKAQLLDRPLVVRDGYDPKSNELISDTTVGPIFNTGISIFVEVERNKLSLLKVGDTLQVDAKDKGIYTLSFHEDTPLCVVTALKQE